MNHRSTGHPDGAGRYEIRAQGHLDPRWSAWFDGMTVTCEDGGSTVIHGHVADQAALHGLLHRLRDTGLPLVSVTRVEADPPRATAIPTMTTRTLTDHPEP